jgi:hypothetical protein
MEKKLFMAISKEKKQFMASLRGNLQHEQSSKYNNIYLNTNYIDTTTIYIFYLTKILTI